ncbi:MAG: hypothetical protein HZA48_11365 [Planctomycetes bacterium]|nr:hypothetical protein [Planctomycetota bacterium]
MVFSYGKSPYFSYENKFYCAQRGNKPIAEVRQKHLCFFVFYGETNTDNNNMILYCAICVKAPVRPNSPFCSPECEKEAADITGFKKAFLDGEISWKEYLSIIEEDTRENEEGSTGQNRV